MLNLTQFKEAISYAILIERKHTGQELHTLYDSSERAASNISDSMQVFAYC